MLNVLIAVLLVGFVVLFVTANKKKKTTLPFRGNGEVPGDEKPTTPEVTTVKPQSE